MTLPTLPKNKGPVYSLILPSSVLAGEEKKIRYRPFYVKDEAALLMVKESEDLESIVETTKQVLSDCILDPINIDELPYFDLSYIFVQIRAKSVGEVAEFKIRCQHCDQDGNYGPVEIDLTKLEVRSQENHNSKIDLGGGLYIQMKYIPFNEFASLDLSSSEASLQSTVSLIASSIESIYTEEELYKASEYSKEDLFEFVQSLTKKQIIKIKEEFFDTMPRLQQDVEYTCPKCKAKNTKTVGNLVNFFL